MSSRSAAIALLAATVSATGIEVPVRAAGELAAPRHAEPAQCKAIGLTACPQPFDAVLPLPSDMLNWDQHSRVIGFRNTYRLYPGDVFHTLGAKAYPLPPAPYKMPPLHYEMDGRHYRLEDYLQRQNVTGLLILKNGRVAYEYYGGANSEKTLWTSRSVAKSVVSILVGMAIKGGFIGSVADPITRYLPELKGSAWEDVTLRDLLQHTSGVVWNEDYADPNSEFAHLTQCEASAAAYECVLHLVTEVKRKQGVKSGELWSYNTGGAWLVGRVLERSTGMTIAHFLETRLWSRFAMQSDGVWQALLEGQVDMGGHGFNATLRDWGRFALFVANGGQLPNGEKLLPTEWIDQSVTWTKADGFCDARHTGRTIRVPMVVRRRRSKPRRYRQCHADREADLWAEGIFGQAIAINRAERLVMVQWSTWKEADTPASLYDEQALFFNAVAHAVGGR